MLESLHLVGAPAFDPIRGTIVGPLKPVNFIFGPNGSGKTTISRAFEDQSRFSGTKATWNSAGVPLGIKVYNSDYVSNTLKQAGNLPGVFLLGKTNAEIQTEIESLTGPKGAIASAKGRVNFFNTSLEEKKGEIKAVRKTLKEAAWTKRSEVPSELHEMFRGVSNSKENFLSKLIDVAAAHVEVKEGFEELRTEAAAVLTDDATEAREIPPIPHVFSENDTRLDLLATPIVGSGDVNLAPLIEQLGNADWVQHGRDYLDQSEAHCPFCQQKIQDDLAERLDAYFDERYIQQLKQLNLLQQHVQTWCDRWRAQAAAILNSEEAQSHINIDNFGSAQMQLDQAVEKLNAAIEMKLTSPSASITIEFPKDVVNAVNVIVAESNVSIKTFNLRLKNRASAKKVLLDRCWVVFARKLLATEVGHFEGAMPALVKGQLSLESKAAFSAKELASKEARLRKLQEEVTSSKPIIETINRLLDSVGFHSFRLKESSAVKDGYSLVRDNGEVAASTLSEGEQTFITFLYFAQSLQGTPQVDEGVEDLVAVIDDPISSLDSDVLYAVSTLVRRIVADIATSSGRVSQLIVLTHNAHFHKEITYKGQGDKSGGWQYGVVRKIHGRPGEVVLSDINPIQTAYGALWDEVKRASKEPSSSGVGLQNILRRIIETYFKVLGGVDNAAIVSKFDGDDQGICRALFSWVNAGSHSIFDDIDYSPTPSTIEANLRVVRRIFKENGQEGHYLMMMGEPANANTTETGAEEAH
ncbi:hypothetical protein ART_3350 [Arthrobacter sp. PAMC 25486]|uniref:AAA family ATPase n=1 Tax=Arthrobacter sp. PAMC 25486 TaxID=1494608 RepID=UPI000535BF77|nr:AAA family ATPase [Arthrobacter sp. PAMC 25486]AIY02949.1 hypothetical protein ART_3350 [Arthrobacter sp. PAMC 25486]